MMPYAATVVQWLNCKEVGKRSRPILSLSHSVPSPPLPLSSHENRLGDLGSAEGSPVGSVPAFKTRNSAIADKPRDAITGQSRSPNIVPFHVTYGFLLVCYSNCVPLSGFSDIRLQKCPHLENRVKVRDGH